jgi:Ca2+-binding RTX toxin-like protein
MRWLKRTSLLKQSSRKTGCSPVAVVEPLDQRMMMAVTASLSARGVLTITGDELNNSIAVSFDAAGIIRVNSGAVPVLGGTPTPANTRLIQIFGLGGNDDLVWSRSANLPSAVVDGGAGNDTLTSGSFNDNLIGGAGNDVYRFDTDAALGRDIIDESGGGIDTLDFSSTTTRGVNIDLSNPAEQVVNAGLSLTLSAGNTIENVIGGAQGDTLRGNSLNNVFEGGGGNDILGGSGVDLLGSGAGNDTFRFDTDNALGTDSIIEFDTIIDSHSGVDRLDFSATTTRAVNIDLGIKGTQVINAGLSLAFGSDTIENVTGGALGDTIKGNALNNVIEGGGGNDSLTGGGGNDTLAGGSGSDIYRFDTDNALGSDSINETSGGDTLDFSATTTRAVKINLATAAAQVVNAGLTLNLLSGSSIENITGGSLGDTLTGNTLNNVIEGRGGNDTLTGASGNDSYRFDTDNALGSDTINESGGGVDALDFSATTTRTVNINLGSAVAQVVNAGLTVTLLSGSTIENVTGGALGDSLTGNALNNVLAGAAGNDVLSGGGGNDTLIGGLGTDILNGGTGTNSLTQ